MTCAPDRDRRERLAYNRSGRGGRRPPPISVGLWQSFGHDRALEAALDRRAFSADELAEIDGHTR